MKIGIWGTGFIAQTHAKALAFCGLELEVVVSRSLENGGKFAKSFGFKHFSTDKNAFIEKGVSAVHVVSPSACHFHEVRFLLENNISVFCEKPLCLSVSEAKILYKLAKDRSIKCCLNLNTRAYPALVYGKNLINQGDLGRILLIHGSYLQEFHCLPCPFDWRYDENFGGKMRAVTEIGSHILNLCEYLSADEIAEVSATFGNFYEKRELKSNMMLENENGDLSINSEDCAIISFKTQKGILGNLVLNEMAKGRKNRLCLEFNGSKKSLSFNSEHCQEIKISTDEGFVKKIFPFEDSGFLGTFISMVEGFYFNRGDFTLPSFYEGLRLCAICEAVFNSAKADSRWTKISEFLEN